MKERSNAACTSTVAMRMDLVLFAMIPRFAYQVNGRRIDVNLYAASSVEVELDKRRGCR